MTAPEQTQPKSDHGDRTAAALPLAIASFAGTYVALMVALPWLTPADDTGMTVFVYVLSLLVILLGLVLVVIPLVVVTLGRMLDSATLSWGTPRAAVAFGGAGLALGLAAAAALWLWGGFSPVVAGVNVAVPAALGGLATRALLPTVLTHRRFRVAVWVLAAVVVVGGVALAAAVLIARG